MPNDTANDLPDLVREEGSDLLAQIAEKTIRIDSKTHKLASLARQTDVARRLQTMAGIGPMTAVYPCAEARLALKSSFFTDD
jgi:transposase